MAIRTITWTVDEDLQVTPTRVQNAGVQGDDNATRVVFSLPAFLQEGYTLYIEYIDGADGYDKTDPLTVSDGGIGFDLPLAWTQHGGKATVRLVAEHDGVVAYTAEGRVRYAGRATAFGKIKSLIEGSIQRALDKVKSEYESVMAYVDERFGAASEELADVKSTTAYLKEREAEITDELYRFPTATELGRVYVPVSANENHSGIINNNGWLSLAPADEQKIDARTDQHCPIVPANLEYAVKSVGDGYYAKVEDFGSGSIEFIVVTELPTEDIKSAIYLLPAAEGAEDNAYDEYIYTNGAWEKIGSAAVNVDMSQYLEKTATSASLNRVYGVAQNGTQKLFNASVNPFGDAVVLYAGGGVIRVNAPTADNHATNKAYVDAAIASVSGTSGGLEEVSRAFVEIESGTGHILPFLKIVYSNGDVKYVCRANTDIEDIDGASYITLDFTAELDSIGFQWDELDHWAGGQTSHIYSVSGTVYASGEMYDSTTDNWKSVTAQIPVGVDGFNKKIHLYNYGYYSEHTGYDDGLYDNRLIYHLGGLEINFYKNPNFSAE